ncbi:hypothetical protein BCR44DRAFT_1426168 [Catenaria anguillulae PL171]|uniref:Uncharacterized protein n=1 Tax=Catenaria anguillulae PL171 TaxID=765915 RepID=A0A1Y2I3T3_9FUNG|nr:hypothetical protein BCR44DRAFT_1454584 [Catenaria anguillulae PL171]ORZ30296.1 hypothetical protein BCR44DRAFT_1445292 [Catenaria anguillulae PL171]ORZ34666.1 hypothetical protein BCR44DRAFT_1436180 [Catenaria anguillulae PL171]ORZ34748.1 hypothetical protein BCR44DRAFT_1435712 [Catenaria anguillulae PL171]ORZ40052.1 hypothetical protein BCR44DRAFT_1426168 [Catenaria anguillulae PL171]
MWPTSSHTGLPSWPSRCRHSLSLRTNWPTSRKPRTSRPLSSKIASRRFWPRV